MSSPKHSRAQSTTDSKAHISANYYLSPGRYNSQGEGMLQRGPRHSLNSPANRPGYGDIFNRNSHLVTSYSHDTSKKVHQSREIKTSNLSHYNHRNDTKQDDLISLTPNQIKQRTRENSEERLARALITLQDVSQEPRWGKQRKNTVSGDSYQSYPHASKQKNMFPKTAQEPGKEFDKLEFMKRFLTITKVYLTYFQHFS